MLFFGHLNAIIVIGNIIYHLLTAYSMLRCTDVSRFIEIYLFYVDKDAHVYTHILAHLFNLLHSLPVW